MNKQVLNSGLGFHTSLALPCNCGRDFELDRIFKKGDQEFQKTALFILNNESQLYEILSQLFGNLEVAGLAVRLRVSAIIIVTSCSKAKLEEIASQLAISLNQEINGKTECRGARILLDPEKRALDEFHSSFSGLGALVSNGVVEAICNSENVPELLRFIGDRKK